MDFKKQEKLASNNPRRYFDEHIQNIDYSISGNKTDVVLALMCISPMLGEFEHYKKLNKYVQEFVAFKNDQIIQFYYYLSQGSYYRYLDLLEQSLESYNTANKLSYLIDDNYLVVRSLLTLSMIFGVIKDLDSALHYARLAMNHLSDQDEPSLIGKAYLWLGAIFGNANELDQANDCLIKAKMHLEKLEDAERNFDYCTVIMNLAKYYFVIKDLDTALVYANKAYSLVEKNDFSGNKQMILSLSADILEQKGNFQDALKYMKDCVKYYETLKLQKDKLIQKYNEANFKSEVTFHSNNKEKNEVLVKSAKKIYNQLEQEKLVSVGKGHIVESVIEALENNEITTFFQCKHSVRNNCVKGAEALVRWIKPDGRMIPPNDYIGYIEDSPVIEKLSKVVIKESFEFCRQMIKAGAADFVVSINISPYQLLKQDIIWTLEKEFALTGLKPQNIEIEITEQSYLGRGEEALKEIKKLKELGVSVSLDDFGSGYASLSSIVYLPFDIIKIDRSLIERIDSDFQAKLLFEGLVDLTKKLNMNVVAEGVETKEQAEIVSATKCDMIQGYYYGKPISAGEFLLLYSKNK